MPFEPTASNVLLVVLAFVAGGTVKGILGIGIPLVAVPLLAGLMPPAKTISLLMVPILAANVWQCLQGGYFRRVVQRFRTLLVALVLGSLAGAQVLTTVDPTVAQLVLGVIVLAFSLGQLLTFRLPEPGRSEIWMSPAIGFFSGLLGGVATFFGPPLIMYLVALRLAKDEFVATIALLYLVGSVPLFTILAVRKVLGPSEALVSLGGAVVVVLGMLVGRWLRRWIPQETFRKGLLLFLIAMGVNLIRRGLA